MFSLPPKKMLLAHNLKSNNEPIAFFAVSHHSLSRPLPIYTVPTHVYSSHKKINNKLAS